MPDTFIVSKSGVVPVFPLPHAVLFPETVLPLHVFEPRYRAMVLDAVAGEGLIAVALAEPGDRGEDGREAFHTMATIGRIEDLRPTPDGRFHLNLVGLQRVRLSEIPSDKPYRLARVSPRPERDPGDDDPRTEAGKAELLASLGYLLSEITEGTDPGFVMNERLPLATAVNSSCANLPVDAAVRQSLLELDDLLERQRLAIEVVDSLLQRVLAAKTEPDDPGDATLH